MASAGPAAPLQPEREHALELLYQMLLIRRFEEKSAELYTLGKIRAFSTSTLGKRPSPSGPCRP